jgi:hypothetical protein
MLTNRERKSGKEMIRRQQPQHVNEWIQTTIVIIVILIVTPNINVGSYIHR